MSDQVVHPQLDGAASPSRRGQSVVEFALVLPVLLVLLLGVADFGRVFSAGIILEAAARNGAEAAAQEYLQLARNSPSVDPADYQRLHDVALAEVCREAKRLPSWSDLDSDGVCEMPRAAVCIHDIPADPDDLTPPPGDPGCGSELAAAPADCSTIVTQGWDVSKDRDLATAAESLAYIEVRVCYRFTTLINLSGIDLPFGWGLSLGDIWLQRDRSFAVADY